VVPVNSREARGGKVFLVGAREKVPAYRKRGRGVWGLIQLKEMVKEKRCSIALKK